MSKRERLQGSKWHKEKDKYELIYTYESERGNIKGLYREKGGTKIVGHWMNNEEKEEYLKKESCYVQGKWLLKGIVTKDYLERSCYWL